MMHDYQRLTVDLPIELHRDFKIWCVLNGKKMNNVIREFLRETVRSSEAHPNLDTDHNVPIDEKKSIATH